jgi:RNA polymerase sigma-70 factor (ECF subfamily)
MVRHSPPRFADAVAAYTSAMMRVAAALVGMADAEDAAQEALLRAWQAWGTLRDLNALRPWLLRITVNVCRSWRRGSFGRQTSHEYPLPDEDTAGMELLAVVSGGPGTSDHTGALDLRRAVDHLPTEFRVVVVLRYYAGMDATEIGAALGIPPSTVRTRLHRALLLLRERLQAAGVVPPRSVWPGGDIA